MKSQWIVVANASNARFLRRASPAEPLVVVARMDDPESRPKASELADDRPGHEAVDRVHGGNRLEPRSDPRRKKHRRFAREIAKRLDDALAEDNFGSLWLFASAPFLGDLKAELGEAVAHRVAMAVSSDWTACNVDEFDRRFPDSRAPA